MNQRPTSVSIPGVSISCCTVRLIEVRQLFELEDFGASEAVDRFRDIEFGPKT